MYTPNSEQSQGVAPRDVDKSTSEQHQPPYRGPDDSTNDNNDNADTAATQQGPPITFNPLKYNLPTRLYNPLTSPTMPNSATSTDRVFLYRDPTALQIRDFLDDIEQAGKDYRMSGGETIGMALYYANKDSKLLWKWMVESANGQDWATFKNHVLWFYPDAFFDLVVQDAFSASSSGELPHPYNVSAYRARARIVGCLRILEDFSTKTSTDRRLCMGFAERLPSRMVKTGHKYADEQVDSWKEVVGKRVRERYPELRDEFDCNPKSFLYYVFLVWREEWVTAENKHIMGSGF